MVEIHSWEDFKAIITFTDNEGNPIDSTTMKFRFVYRDESGKNYEVSNDGETRINNVVNDGQLYGIFNAGAFRYGVLTVERHYFKQDDDFPDGVWDFGGEYKTNIKIV